MYRETNEETQVSLCVCINGVEYDADITVTYSGTYQPADFNADNDMDYYGYTDLSGCEITKIEIYDHVYEEEHNETLIREVNLGDLDDVEFVKDYVKDFVSSIIAENGSASAFDYDEDFAFDFD